MPPVLNYPGVYIEELPSGVHTITGVATSITAFAGWAPKGPVNQATLVLSFSDFQNQFGGLNSQSYLGYAVNQFFANGGQQAYIVRITWDGTLTPAPGTTPIPSASASAIGVGVASAAITAASGGVSGSAEITVGPAVLQSITITPGTPPSLPIGLQQQFAATGNYSDGSTATLSPVTWGTNAPAVATVDGSGLVTANGPGMCLITATQGSVTATVTLTVTAATLSSVTITPASPSVGINLTQQLTATASYSDGTSQDVTAAATWKSSAALDATVNGSGLVTGVAAGSPQITATWGGTPATVTVTVSAVLQSITISPANPTVQSGQPALPFAATGNYSDNSTSDLTSSVTWSSANTAVATVNASGHATRTGTGSTVITATLGSMSANTTLTETAATLNSISVAPASASIAVGLTVQLKATGSFSDGTMADLSGAVTWTPTAGVTVSSTGVATGGTAGTSHVTAAWEGVTSAAVAITIVAPVLVSIAVTPSSKTLLTGQTQQLKATGTYSDKSTQDLTATAAWSSSASGIVTVSPAGLATAVASGGTLTLYAANPGAWGNNLSVNVAPQPGNPSRFGLQVLYNGQVVENYVNLSSASGDPQFVVTVIDNDSSYITFVNPATGNPPSSLSGTPATATGIIFSGGADGSVLMPQDGVNGDGNFELALGLDPPATTFGIPLLNRVDIFNLLCVPGETDAVTIQNMQAFCLTERAFAIVDSPQTATTSGLNNSGPAGWDPGSITGANSDHSAYYYPWVLAPDPLIGNRNRLFPPSGFVSGIYAATDANRGVWKAPAGIDASLTGVSGLQYVLTDAENGLLNVQGINCLRQFKTYGDVVWGARTLQGSDQAGSQWKYVSIRRFALFLESSLYEGTQWVVFEPNDETLWSQIRLNVGSFLQGLFLQGAFQGTTPQQAYFVKCDSENNPQSSIDLGIVNILVGFAPLYPAEFVVIQIQQMAGQTQS